MKRIVSESLFYLVVMLFVFSFSTSAYASGDYIHDPMQNPKAPYPISSTLGGMMVFLHPNMSELVDVLMIALQLLRESYSVLPGSTMMEVRPEQAPNA